jgi:hypothetical protein
MFPIFVEEHPRQDPANLRWLSDPIVVIRVAHGYSNRARLSPPHHLLVDVATKFLRTILASYASRALCQQPEVDIVTTLRLFSHVR